MSSPARGGYMLPLLPVLGPFAQMLYDPNTSQLYYIEARYSRAWNSRWPIFELVWFL